LVRLLDGRWCGCSGVCQTRPEASDRAAPPEASEERRVVQLVRRDGRDVSTLYGREGGGGRQPCAGLIDQ
jgi:hypothetical protein